jgi:succinyl-diaminopimelate desuccinylase
MIFAPSAADAMGRTVQNLVSIKSLSGDEALVADFIQQYLRDVAGLPAQRDDQDNVVAVLDAAEPGDPGEMARTTLHLSGHTDTVVPVEGWQGDPWRPEISGTGDERRIVGLGTSDMKSGLAVMLHLAAHFAEKQRRLRRLRVVFSFTVCEETPARDKMNGVNRVLEKHPGRWALTTEASCDAISPTLAIGCQGHAVARLSLRGRSAHSANPDKGLNAIHAAARVCERVERLNKGFKEIHVLGDVHARAAAAVTVIKGGSAGNIIPEQCDLTISRRVAPGETTADVERELHEITRNLDGVQAAWKLRCDAPACVVDAKGPLLQCAADASRALFNQVRYSWNRARTDMVLFKQAGMDVLNIGPGFTGQAHVAGEYVRVVDLPRSANLIAATMQRLDQWLVKEGV